MFLYTNPAAFFTIDKKWTADVSASLFEKDEDIEGRYGLYAATVGYKLAKRHAVFAGFRYAGGLKLKGFDMLGNPTKDYKPYDWTIDMGYSYLIGNGFSALCNGVVSSSVTSQRMPMEQHLPSEQPIRTMKSTS